VLTQLQNADVHLFEQLITHGYGSWLCKLLCTLLSRFARDGQLPYDNRVEHELMKR
jgi:hypothetical protein